MNARSQEAWLQCGALLLQVSTGRVYRNGFPAVLDTRLLQLLLALARADGYQLSKDALLKSIWGADTQETALTQSIYRLRLALEDNQHQVLVALRSKGYELRCQPGLAPAGETRADRDDTHNPTRSPAMLPAQVSAEPAPAVASDVGVRKPRRFLLGLVLVLALLGLAASPFWLPARAEPRTNSAQLAAMTEAVDSQYPPRIRAVLPRIEQALEREPDSAALLALYSKAWSIDYEIGMSRISAVLERALPAAQHAVAINPEYSEAHSALGLALLNLDRFAQARTAYEQALKLAPNSAYARSRIGLMQSLTMSPIEAAKSYARAGQDFDDVWNKLGVVFNEAYAGQPRTAQFDELLRRSPSSVYIPYEYAWTERWAGRTAHARAVMEAEHQREPGQAWTIAILAELRRLSGDEAGAAALIQLHAPLYNKFDGDNSLLAWRLLARYAPDSARTLEQAILKEKTELAYLWWCQAEILLARGERVAALKLMERAWELDRRNGVWLRNWRVDLGSSELLRHEELLAELGQHAQLRYVVAENQRQARQAYAQGVRAMPLTELLARYERNKNPVP